MRQKTRNVERCGSNARRGGPIRNKRAKAAWSTIRMQKLFRLAAWFLILAIVILSLAPAAVRPTTIAGSGAEHFFIFLAAGLAFGFGYPRKPWFIASVLLIFAAFIEITQNWVPGRHARMSDFMIEFGGNKPWYRTVITFQKLFSSAVRRQAGQCMRFSAMPYCDGVLDVGRRCRTLLHKPRAAGARGANNPAA